MHLPVTAGNTQAPIDSVRYITNNFTDVPKPGSPTSPRTREQSRTTKKLVFGRLQLKCISFAHLSRKDGTEYH